MSNLADHAGKTGAPKNKHPRPGPGGAAVFLAVCAPLLWLPQAGLAAHAIGLLADGASVERILPLATGFVLFGLLRATFEALAARLAFKTARAELSARRLAAVRTLAARSPVDIGRPSSGEAASALAEQSEMLTPWLSRYIPARMKAMVVPFAVAAATLPFSWIAALALLVTAPVIPLFMALVGMQAQKASERQLARMGDINAFLIDRLRGLATIRTLGAVEETARRLRHEAEDLKRRTMAVLKIAFLTSATLELFSALGVALTAVYIGFHLLGFIDMGTWGTRLTLAEGLFVLMIAPSFFEPLRELSAVWHDRAAGEAALKSLDHVAGRGEPLPWAGNAADVSPADMKAIIVNALHYAHPGRDTAVIGGFSLTVRAGERIAISAPSGAGKTTLLSLLAGLAAPGSGAISLFGKTPATARRAREIAWIGQNAHVFSGSITANVALGRDEADVAAALSVARLERVAATHGKTPLGEGGSGLSGGEAVRLAIARAAANPNARLILADEPTAHLDAATARLVIDGLLALAEGRTLIVATHDPLLAAAMDRTVLLASPPEDRA